MFIKMVGFEPSGTQPGALHFALFSLPVSWMCEVLWAFPKEGEVGGVIYASH